MYDAPLFGSAERRELPANVQAELAVLGSLLANNRNLDVCSALLPEHFVGEGLGEIYLEIRSRVQGGRATDAVSLKGKFDQKLLAQLLSAHVANNVVPEYARAIVECAGRRSLFEAGQRMIDGAADGLPLHEITAYATSAIEAVAGDLSVGSSPSPLTGLNTFLAIETWAEREMPPPDRLLGDLVTTTTRMFLVGSTGLGKTLLALALGCGMSSGQGFLHWRSTRAARVLVIDGEMPGELIRQRAIDALRRAGIVPKPDHLMIYARDQEDDFAERFPTLGPMPPLNTEPGTNWTLALIAALGGVDMVIFDNVMSLLVGIQKEEEAWAGALRLVQRLTAKRIGQIWIDHTGHDGGRQYGTSTKAWRFDAVGIMLPLAANQRSPHEIAFTLSFEHPGKARRRTPDNWQDFETVTIRLREDRWTSEGARIVPRGPAVTVSPQAKEFHNALRASIGKSLASGKLTRDEWFAECTRAGLVTAIEDGDSHAKRDAKRALFRKHLATLKRAGWIAVDGEIVKDLTGDSR